jgi:hypothetical protein
VSELRLPHERRRVEPLANRLRPVVRILSGHQIWPIRAARVGPIGAAGWVSGESARQAHDVGHLPAAQNRGADSVLRPLLACTKRQLVKDRRDDAVPDVEDLGLAKRSPSVIAAEDDAVALTRESESRRCL